jgi:predicted oxidoreductase (fatty acid repression mutant protein)
MGRTFMQALENRRTYYSIGSESPVSDEKIEEVIKFAVKNVPSAFNSQSTRVVLLLGENHKKLWNITKDILRKIVPAEAFKGTESKIDNSFLAGHGTVLFFENQDVVKGLQNAFPSYADNFPVWSQQTSAMHQLAIWTMLEDLGLGVNLQHYNPLIDEAVAKEWSIPATWKLIAEMPFGKPLASPGEKEFKAIEERVKIFK